MRMAVQHALLRLRLAAAIGVERGDSVTLDVGSAAAPVEYQVAGEGHEPHAVAFATSGEYRWPEGILAKATFHIALGPVHLHVARGIDDRPRAMAL
jgi:hypothetical protein